MYGARAKPCKYYMTTFLFSDISKLPSPLWFSAQEITKKAKKAHKSSFTFMILGKRSIPTSGSLAI